MENRLQTCSSPLRQRSLSPSILRKGMIPSPQRPSPRPPTVPSPNHRKARSSPLVSRPLSALNNAPTTPTPEKSGYVEEESIHVSPVQLHVKYAQPSLLLPPKESNQSFRRNPYAGSITENEQERTRQIEQPQTPADSTATSSASYCSTPSSTFMELIYSASASTSATPDVLATPEIFRGGEQLDLQLQLQEQMAQQHTPVIKNTNNKAATAAPSPSSTLQSMTPRNQQHVRAEWWVPRINTTNIVSTSTNNQTNNDTSPFSLPSMLGAPSAEEISELESPMLLDFQPSAEESDIQSQSQATDINSMKTMTPVATRLVRCNAQDEDDAPTQIKPATSPTLTQLASGSALCVSREEVVAASYEFNDTDSEMSESYKLAPSQTGYGNGTSLLRDIGEIIPAQITKTRESYTIGNRVTSRLFFRSSIPTPSPKTHESFHQTMLPDPYAEWRGGESGEDGDISELSSQYESSRVGEGVPVAPSTDVPEQNCGMDKSISESTNEISSENPKGSFTDSRLGVILQLIIIIVLALAVIVPLAVVLIHIRNKSNNNVLEQAPSSTPIILTEEPAGTLTRVSIAPTSNEAVSTKEPTLSPILSSTSMPTFLAPEQTAQITTISPTSFPTLSPTLRQTLPTTMPVQTETLPPFTAVWTESTWSTATIRFGPVWPSTGSGAPLELTVLNSLTDPDDWSALEAVIQDWGESASVNLNLESSALLSDECVPTLGVVRVCNGAYGDTENKLHSNVYVNNREIMAVTIVVNDDFGLETLATAAALRYNFCHEVGHALGLFHSSRGCMVEALTVEEGQSSYLSPDPLNFAELERLYGGNQRNLRRWKP